jgi:LacI family transcriptional regulator
MGEQAANLLIDRLELDDEEDDVYVDENEIDMDFKTVVIETELIERESTK